MPPNDGHHGPAPTDAPPELAGYRLVDLLGRGGMGEVWRAEREGPGGIRKRAAVKRILPRLQGDPVLRERFLAEARTNARLEHPNIVQVVDFGTTPEPFLVLEYVEGVTAADLLREAIRAHSRIPVVAAAFICAEIATGLDYAHRRRDDDGRPLGIIHRDVSPQNILVSLDGAVKISDFGVAHAADNRLRTEVGTPIGKTGYMAPEQVEGRAYDSRADIFALGVTFWELLTLSPLVPHKDAAAAIDALLACNFLAPSQADNKLPPSVDAVVMRALARNPDERYPTAGTFAKAIRGFVHSIAPGFDSNELVRICMRLAPAVRFRSATSSFTPVAPIESNEAGPYASAHAEMPAFGAAHGAAAPPARAAFPPTIVSEPIAPPTAAPPRAQSAPQPWPAPNPAPPQQLPPHHVTPMAAAHAVRPSMPDRGSNQGALVAALLVGLAASATFAGTLGYRAWVRHSRPHRLTLTTAMLSPTRAALAPRNAVAPPTTSLALPMPSPVEPAIDADAGSAPIPGPSPASSPTAANGTRAASATRTAHVDRAAAARSIQQQLTSARGLIRACLGVREGSGAQVTLIVHYDGAGHRVSAVDVSSTSGAPAAREQVCVLETVRNTIHVNGVTGSLNVSQIFEF